MIRKSYCLVFLLLIVLIVCSQTRTWNGGNGDWNDASKWTPVGIPVETDIIEFNNGAAKVFNVPTYSFKGINISSGAITLQGMPGAEQRILLGSNSQRQALKVFSGA